MMGILKADIQIKGPLRIPFLQKSPDPVHNPGPAVQRSGHSPVPGLIGVPFKEPLYLQLGHVMSLPDALFGQPDFVLAGYSPIRMPYRQLRRFKSRKIPERLHAFRTGCFQRRRIPGIEMSLPQLVSPVALPR